MGWLYLIIFLQLLLPENGSASSSILRVETGHQHVEIDGRDPYLGYFTRIRFHDITCVQGLLVHCLKPLTGAEEIDILLSQCPRGNWKVVHYTNTKEEFRLKTAFNARHMMIVSRQPLNIIDVQVQACHLDNTTLQSSGCTYDHLSRHGRTGPIRATELGKLRRFKRDLSSLPEKGRKGPEVETIPASSELEFFEDKVVEVGKTLQIEQGSRLSFGDGVGLQVYGTLIVNGSKYSPVKFHAANNKWKGVVIHPSSVSSCLKYLNISQSSIGLSVENGGHASIENVIVDGNDIGLKVHTDSPHFPIYKAYAINNAGSGFQFSGKGTVKMDTCISASNREHGIQVEDSFSLSLSSCNLFSNSKKAIYASNLDRLEVVTSVIDGNGAGFFIQNIRNDQFTMTLSSVNISNHHYGPTVHIRSTKTFLEIEHSLLYDNYNGVVHLEDNDIQLEIANTNFTRNRGKIVFIPLLSEGRVIVGRSVFHANQFNNYADQEAIIDITTGVYDPKNASINIFQNEFSKNIMNHIVSIRRVTGAMVNTIISESDFHANLAQSIIKLSGMTASIQYNFLHNVQTSCDIIVPLPTHAEEAKNYWGYDSHKEILEHICSNNESVDGLHYVQDEVGPFESSFPSPSPMNITTISLPKFENTYNLLPKNNNPYYIEKNLIIQPDQSVIVEPGTKFLFAPGAGIVIEEKGKLYLNGTNEDMISFSGTDKGIWKGITVKAGGTLILYHTTLNDPAVGISIDSDRVNLNGSVINRPTNSGIEIYGNSGYYHDLGNSVIRDALATAVLVHERKDGILISNVSIENPTTGGIDFVSPSGNISLKSISISGSRSHSIHVSEYSTAPLLSLSLENIIVKDQKRGHSAIFVSSGWIRNLLINGLKSQNNNVPTVVVSLECDSTPSMTRITNSQFLENLDTVVLLQLGECGGLDLNHNLFRLNNQNGRAGALRIDVQPAESNAIPITISGNNFIENKGDFTAFLSSDNAGIKGKFENNSLEDNSNSVATVVVTSPFYALHNNRFSNPHSAYEVEARGDGSWIVDASNNWWGLSNEQEIMSRLKSFEGAVKVTPIRTGEFEPDVIIVHPDKEPPPVSTLFQACVASNFCSYRGSCLAGICLCPAGYLGVDCSIITGCKNNCSNHGTCNLFNLCDCLPGYTSADCSVPICSNNCGGNGECIDKDKCSCQPNWTGDDCMTPACSSENCINGTCNKDKTCTCNQGYSGKYCSKPICSSCSLNGRCVGPEKCECFEDYGGNDCTQCVGPSCNECDFDCDHGTCEHSTRTCSCSSGWSGAACDVCSTASCIIESAKIVYIQPATSSITNLEGNVLSVFGKNFQKMHNGTYYCIFGTAKTTGIRVSSTLIRCQIPNDLSSGRHLFNIAYNDDIALSIDNRPLHFTVYEACDQSKCKGTCYGPLCLCPQGKTGLFCDIIELKPEIDKLFLTNQVANKGVEGTPYIVYLPSLPGTVFHVNSTIPNLYFDSSRSLLEWSDPVGKETPHSITVIANSLAGETSLTWDVLVDPSYTPVLDDINTDGKLVIVKGHIDNGNLSMMPVAIDIFGKDGRREEAIVTTDDNGSFSHSFIPNGAGTYEINVRHPGRSVSKHHPQALNIEAESLELLIQDHGNGKVIGLTDQTCKPRLTSSSTSLLSEDLVEHGKLVNIEFNAGSLPEEYILLTCADDKKEILRIENNKVQEPSITITPSSLLLRAANPKTQLIEISINTKGVILPGPISVSSPLNRIFIVSSNILLEDYTSYSNGKENLTLSFQMEVNGPQIGSIIFECGGETLTFLPYSIVPDNSEYFQGENFQISICLYDEFKQIPQNNLSKSISSLSLTNLQMKKDVFQNNVVVNGKPSSFWIPEGFYQITAISPNHEVLSTFMKLSPHELHVCLPLKGLSPIVATHNEDGSWTTTYISKPTGSYPLLEFKPSLVENSVKSILATSYSPKNGIISPRTEDTPQFLMTPSVRSLPVNESFWISVKPKNHQQSLENCDLFLHDMKFDYLPEGASDVITLSSPIIIQSNDKLEGATRICNANNNSVESATTTEVFCDCLQGAKARCRENYKSPAACGSAWNRIYDDTVTLHMASSFLLMISECNDVKINFADLYNTLQCLSELETKCPQPNQRVKRDYSTFTNQYKNFITPVNVYSPLDLQTNRIASLYQDFIQRLQDVFPEVLMRTDRKTVDQLISALGDNSEGSNFITSKEYQNIQEDSVSNIWNATVNDWTSGKWSSNYNKGIQYASMKQLVASADRLKSFTRQNGGTDPFAVLHEYLGRLFKTNSNPEKICASATVQVKPSMIYENDLIHIKVFIENKNNISLGDISLDVDIARDDAFSPPVKLVANGISVNTLNSKSGLELNGNSSFEASWTKRLVFSNQLTSIAKYQLAIVLSFIADSKVTKQRLHTRQLEIHPSKSLKLVHFIAPTLSDNKIPFSVMTSIMNTGYTDIGKVRVESTNLQVTNNEKQELEYHLSGLAINQKPKVPTTSYDVGPIKSGSSQTITVNITSSDSTAWVSKIKTLVSADGTSIPTDDSSIYKVHATAGNNGILVSLLEQDQPLFFFRPETGNIVNIIPLEMTKSTVEHIDNPSRALVTSSFKNLESRSFFGYLYGSIPYPDIPPNYQLIQIRETGNNRQRDVRPIIWVEGSGSGKKLHFIDSGSLSPTFVENYQFVFADPADISVPLFDQNSYRIQLYREAYPEAGSPIGQINVEDEHGDVEYALYAPDDSASFSVNPKTGHIFMDSLVLPGQETCLLLTATKSNGEEASVPVAINTGGPRRDCLTFNPYGLTPHIHPGLPPPTTSSTSSPTQTTMEMTTPESVLSTTIDTIPTDFPKPSSLSTTNSVATSETSETSELTTFTTVVSTTIQQTTLTTETPSTQTSISHTDFPIPSSFPTSGGGIESSSTSMTEITSTSVFPSPSDFPTDIFTHGTSPFPMPSIFPTSGTEFTKGPTSSSPDIPTTTDAFPEPSTIEIFPDSTLASLTSTVSTAPTTYETTHENIKTTISPTDSSHLTSNSPDPHATTEGGSTHPTPTDITSYETTSNGMTSSRLSSLPTLPTSNSDTPGGQTTPGTSETSSFPTSNPWIPITPWIPSHTTNKPLTSEPTSPTSAGTSSDQTTVGSPSSMTSSATTMEGISTGFTHLITPDSTITPIIISTQGVTSDGAQTTQPSPQTENPFYGKACDQPASALYSLICELNKTVIDVNV